MTVRFLRDNVLIPLSSVPELVDALAALRENVLHTQGLDAAIRFDQRWRAFVTEARFVDAASDVLDLYDDDDDEEPENRPDGPDDEMNLTPGEGETELPVPVQAIASRTTVSTTYLNRLCRNGELRASKAGGRWVVSPSDARRFVADHPLPKETHACQ